MQANVGSESVASEVVDAVLRASRVLVAVAARSLAGIGDEVTLSQYRALVVLASQGPQRPSELASALESHPSTVTRLCDRLVQSRLISRAPSASDRREVTITLTAKGRRLVDRVTVKRRAELATILAGIPRRQHSELVRALDALGDAADEPSEVGGLW